jgi:hypothetical protein
MRNNNNNNWWQDNKGLFNSTVSAPELTLKLVRAEATFETATAAEGELLSVVFSYFPGYAPHTFGPPDSWDDGTPAELNIKAIRTLVPLHFEESGIKLEIAAGHDITNLFSLEEIEKFAEQLLARAEAGAQAD